MKRVCDWLTSQSQMIHLGVIGHAWATMPHLAKSNKGVINIDSRLAHPERNPKSKTYRVSQRANFATVRQADLCRLKLFSVKVLVSLNSLKSQYHKIINTHFSGYDDFFKYRLNLLHACTCLTTSLRYVCNMIKRDSTFQKNIILLYYQRYG